MKFIRHYFHEIYSVATMTLITLSAIFVQPDAVQQLALAYMLLFLLHEWEETVYPGGFFDALFGEVMQLRPVPSGERLLNARVYVYLLLLVFTLPPYFAHSVEWLLLPICYLGFVEGIAHNVVPRVFRLKRKWLPGVVTAVCQFALSVYTMVFFIREYSINPWLYLLGFVIFAVGFFLMGRLGMAANGIDFRTVPGKVKESFKQHRK